MFKPYENEIEYVYSDISVAFINYGKKHFSDKYPFVSFQRLDLEKEATPQGFENDGVDLVLATDVVHATKDIGRTLRNIKQLLKRNGILILNETTQFQPLNSLTFGLLDGWWAFEDEEHRSPHGPLLSEIQWQKMLREEGFKRVLVFGGPKGEEIELGQRILVAESDGVVSIKQERENLPGKKVIENRRRVESKNSRENIVFQQVANTLGVAKEDLDPETPFSELGVDSILAVNIINQINEALETSLRSTDLFNFSTLESLITHIEADYGDPVVPEKIDRAIPEISQGLDIAVIGMSGRFADADNLGEFWDNLSSGLDSVREIPASRWQSHVSSGSGNWGGFLKHVDQFDPLFFNISPKEAELMDPQQRLFLEESWKALEDAGYSPKKLSTKKRAVFVGCKPGDYEKRIGEAEEGDVTHSFMGNAASILSARISYLLNLKGPSIAIETACSSSLVAIHMACESMALGHGEMALAGGVCVWTTPGFHTFAKKAGMLSPSGKCKTFDQGADGFVPGEGVGVILLKPLRAAVRDGDHIYGVLKATGLNQDGKTNGITAPNGLSQTALINEVYSRYNINPETISYIEAHGTGTPLGDPIEINALIDAFGAYTEKVNFCAVGSVKTNIGHTAAAAGVAGVIKVLLCMQH